MSPSGITERIAQYKAWRAHWDAPRPLDDDCDPYRCPVCDAKMKRDPWACPTHGEIRPKYSSSSFYRMNLSRKLNEEEKEWEPDRDWCDLLDDLIEEREQR